MKKASSMHISVTLLIMAALAVVYSCGNSSPNMSTNTSSSAAAKFVTCPAAPAAVVSITSFPAFAPASTSIAVNGVVKWTNSDSIIHTVTSGPAGAPDGRFDSGNLAPNATACVQFLAAGSYAYFCNIHTFMTGIVTVQ